MQSRRTALLLGVAALGAARGLQTGQHAARAQPAPSAASPRPIPQPPPLPYRPHAIRTPDGVLIQAYEYGNPDGPAILFLHGFAQSALSWDRQTRDPDLSREFRMVAYDLRGHGMSGKPEGDQYYKPSKPWGDEVRAVIEQIGLRRPVLVGWSYAGRAMGDYLLGYGHEAIVGMNWVSAASSTSRAAC